MRKRPDGIYWVWSAMIQRCTNPRNRQYKDYGGRGITVCDRWRTFINFAADMGPRPGSLTLERVDNNQGYRPDNCKWVTRREQNSNKRNCIYVLNVNGRRVTLKEYCDTNSLPYRAIAKRISERGWPIEMAIALPAGRKQDAALIQHLWDKYTELQQYLSLALDAADGRPVLNRVLDEARSLCGDGPEIRIAA